MREKKRSYGVVVLHKFQFFKAFFSMLQVHFMFLHRNINLGPSFEVCNFFCKQIIVLGISIEVTTDVWLRDMILD